MILNKPKCNLCQNTIRKNIQPLKCKKCSSLFHKKCAKIKKNESLSPGSFCCSHCISKNQNSCFADESLNNNTNAPALQTSINAEQLNSLFCGNNDCENQDCNTPNSYNFDEKYIEIDSTNMLNFDQNNSNSFFVISINIRSLANTLNFCKLQAFVGNLNPKPDIIAVTETWIKNNKPGPYNTLNNYNFISNSRVLTSGGGVGFYVKSCYKFTVIDEMTKMNEKNFESIFIKLELPCGNLLCGNIYRSPTTSKSSTKIFLDNLLECLDICNKTSKRCFITGDFNYDLGDQNNIHVSNFVELMLECHYFPVINKPSRITDSSATVIDHIWTNLHSHQIKSGAILSPLSDHLPVYMSINLQKHFPFTLQQKRFFTSQNITKFNQELKEIDILPILCEKDTNSAFKLLMTDYKAVFENSFPLLPINAKTKCSQPWFDKDLQLLSVEKNKAFKKFLLKKSFFNRVKFNKTRNLYNRALLKKKQSYYNDIFQKFKNNLKETWKNINKQLGKCKSTIFTSLKINNELISDSEKISNHFNDYFVSVASNLVSNLPLTSFKFEDYLPCSSMQSIYFYPTNLIEMKRLLGSLKPKTSAGVDEIPPCIIKSTPDNILLALTHIFNLSLEKGEFISEFKTAKVIPIHKKDSLSNVSNYRPISLLCTMSKLLERLVYNRILSYLNKENFFFENQFGFRKNHSTCHATTLLVESIADAFENRKSVLGLFLDLSKAFDTIDHKILLSKLWHYGIRGVAHQWLCSYLSNRMQLVEINGVCSETKPIKFGVPQGSIIGPLLFSIYVNDFNKCLTMGKCFMYADDTNVFFQDKCYKSLYATAQEQLLNIENWLLANRLSLNIDKTHFLVFRTPHTTPPSHNLTLSIRNQPISLKSQTKFLGILFDRHLSWKPHMEFVLRKICIGYGTVKKISKYFNKKTLLLLYDTLITSHIRYCITTWYYGNKSTALKIQRIANKFIRIIYNLHYRDSVTNIMQENNIMTIDQLSNLEMACFMHKYTKNKLPNSFNNYFSKNLLNGNNKSITRTQSQFFPLYCRLELTKQSLKYKGPFTWNKIPLDIKQINSYEKFRKTLQIHLTQK